MKRQLTILVLLLLPFAAAAEDMVDQLSELLNRYSELGQFNGAALVAEKNDVLLNGGYGFADFAEARSNLASNRFFVGSISKSFTASLVLRLVDEGKLDLDKTVADYLPWYRSDTGSQITLQHLITHQDGLANYTNNPAFWQPYDEGESRSTQNFIETYCSSDLLFAPGSRYQYGNAGYSILGGIIEQVTGASYAQVLEEKILKPSGMGGSGDSSTGAAVEGFAKGYQMGPDGYRAAAPVYKPLFAAGAMYATVHDLLLYADSLDYDELTRRALRNDAAGAFVYGWTVGEYTPEGSTISVRTVSTNGEVNGYNALLIRVVETRQTIILLSNTGETDLGNMAVNILRVLNGEQVQQPMPRTRDGFYEALQQQGVDAAIAFYREHRETDPNDYIYFRWPLRILASQLIDDDRVEDATRFLELNLETHPDDARSQQMLAGITTS